MVVLGLRDTASFSHVQLSVSSSRPHFAHWREAQCSSRLGNETHGGTHWFSLTLTTANRVFRSVNCVHCHLSFVRVCLMSINEDLFSRFPALNSLLIYWCCDLELVASLRARCIFTYCRLCGVFMLFYLDTFFMSSGKVLDLIFNTIWEAFSINRESKFNN